jgi:hypothetical protein
MALKALTRAGMLLGTALSMGIAATPASAEVILTPVNMDLSGSPFSFTFMGGSFTFDGSGGFPNFLSVQTGGGAAVRTVFGNPSTDFPNRGFIQYDQNTLGGFGSFSNLTPVPFSNGENFLGLKVTSGGQDYFGFAYTTNTVLNGFGFETMPGMGIIPTTTLTGAVPEPATWALLLLGFLTVGAFVRGSKARQRLTLSYS